MEITQGARFDTLGLSPAMLRALNKKGYEESTPIQAGCIPPMLEWKDVTAKAPTGTGKTFAFGIPIIEHIDTESDQLQAVILAPTRELALQITSEMRDLAQFQPGIRTADRRAEKASPDRGGNAGPSGGPHETADGAY